MSYPLKESDVAMLFVRDKGIAAPASSLAQRAALEVLRGYDLKNAESYRALRYRGRKAAAWGQFANDVQANLDRRKREVR